MVPLENNVALGVDQVGKGHALLVVAPLVEEVLQAVLGHVNHGSLQEPLLEVLVLGAVLQVVEHVLHSPSQDSVEDLPNRPGPVRDRLVLSLCHGLRRMVPVLESLGQVEVHVPLDDLDHLPHELAVLLVAFLHGLEASSHDFAVPLGRSLLGPLSKVQRSLRTLEPLPQRLSLADEANVVAQDLLVDPQSLQLLRHFDKGVVVASKLFELDDPVGARMLGLDDL